MKLVEKETKSGVKFSYSAPETVAEATKAFGEEKTLQFILYSLGVAEARKVTAPPPLPKGLTKAMSKDPELRAKVEAVLREKGLLG